MSVGPAGGPLSLALETGDAMGAAEIKSCCAAVYEHPAVRWLLGGELHPGGEDTTRSALEMAGLAPGDRLLDIASGSGASALLGAVEFGAEVTGIEYGDEAVRGAMARAEEARLGDRVRFIQADAEALPLADGSFDAVLCECSLCTFPDKSRALAEMRRVLRPGGVLALSDVVVDRERLPERLRGPLATIACVGDALTQVSYESLLAQAGFELRGAASRDQDAENLARRVEERLRGARLLGLDRLAGSPFEIEQSIELLGDARRAIADGALGYVIITAVAGNGG